MAQIENEKECHGRRYNIKRKITEYREQFYASTSISRDGQRL